MDLLQGAPRPDQRVALVMERGQVLQLVFDLGVLHAGENQYRGQPGEGRRNVGLSGDLGKVALVRPEPVVDVAHVSAGAM
jgi:hypothetical protein